MPFFRHYIYAMYVYVFGIRPKEKGDGFIWTFRIFDKVPKWKISKLFHHDVHIVDERNHLSFMNAKSFHVRFLSGKRKGFFLFLLTIICFLIEILLYYWKFLLGRWMEEWAIVPNETETRWHVNIFPLFRSTGNMEKNN